MKKRGLFHILIVALTVFVAVTEAAAQPDQGLMICVKNDPAGNYVDTDLGAINSIGSADLDGDGDMDGSDLATLAAQRGRSTAPIQRPAAPTWIWTAMWTRSI